MSERPSRRWSRTEDPRPVGIVHAPADRTVALHLLGDLRSLGMVAVLVEHGGRNDPGSAVWDQLRAVALLHSRAPWWSDAFLADLAAFCATGRPAAVVRGEPLAADPLPLPRYLPALRGIPVHVLTGRDYKPGWRGGSGYTFLAEVLGVGPEPAGEARHGHVFVSYRGADAVWVFDEIVPALAEQGFGLFDYRATEELDESDGVTLDAELDRWLERSAVLLVVATPAWPESRHTRRELRIARSLGRAVVTVRRPRARALAEVDRPDAAVRFSAADRHGPALAAAIRRASADRRPAATRGTSG